MWEISLGRRRIDHLVARHEQRAALAAREHDGRQVEFVSQLRQPHARVIGIEPVGAPKLSRAREAGKPVKLAHTNSIADGLLAVEIGHLTFEHHARYIDDVVLVDDEAIKRAMRLLLDRAKLIAEPSGAITAAALMEGRVRVAGPTVAVLSGGNIEWSGLTALME